MSEYKILPPVPGRIFVFGDIHGCKDELQALLSFVETKERLSSKDHVIFIGDYIDRGPDSKGVIDLLIAFKARYQNVSFLKGNHEDMCLGFLGLAGSMGELYLDNGGRELIESYGLKKYAKSAELFMAMPEAHREFLATLDRYIVGEQFIFVHAGVNPLQSLDSQRDEEIFWIRDEFIYNVHHFGKTVIFGHTPFQEVVVHLPYKVGIDTGLVFGNKLTCLEVIQGKVHQVKRGEREVTTTSLAPEIA